jgi:hypothetical protein
MPAISDAPTGVGTPDAWNLGAGASKAAAVATADDATTYIWATSAVATDQMFTFPAVPSGIVDPLNSVILYGRWKREVLGSSRLFSAIYSDAVSAVNQESTLAVTGTWYTINPFHTATLAERTIAQANGEHGMRMHGGTGFEVHCTQFLRYIDYTFAAGGFVWLLGLVGSIGANLMLHEMQPLAAYLGGLRFEGGRRKHTLKSDELTEAWREWREYRHPVFAF